MLVSKHHKQVNEVLTLIIGTIFFASVMKHNSQTELRELPFSALRPTVLEPRV